jgi:steroid delta-isomerase-like uncharacterized protein
MSPEDNKALVVRYIESLNEGNLPSEEFIGPGFVFHDPGMPDVVDLAGIRRFVAETFSAFPDLSATVEDLIAEGDRVVCRYTSRMTHQRDFMDIPATGRQLTTNGIAIYRIAAGKIQEEWVCSDRLGLMQQLGIVAK